MPRKKTEANAPATTVSKVARKGSTQTARDSATGATKVTSAKPRASRKKAVVVAGEESLANLQGAVDDAGQRAITAEQIAERAYFRWLERGCPQGTAEQDWIDAEIELGVHS